MFSITIWHEALGKYQVVRGRTEAEARMKADMKKATWNAQYARSLVRSHKRQTAEDKRAEREALKDEAAERTEEAEQAVAELGDVLTSIFNASPVYEIAKQKIVAPFGEPQPQPPKYLEYSREPKREDWTFVPEFDFLDKLFAFRRDKKVRLGEKNAENEFVRDHAQWLEEIARVKKTNEDLYRNHEQLTADHSSRKAAWEEN